ncbi:MAG TPA: DUF6134 family protein [Hyphomonadaceae bacterium]|nr:DUF6134 family protein [Hyphomonadaceae bacterium]
MTCASRLAAVVVLLTFAMSPAEAQAWKPSDGEQLAFDVYRDGSRFGTHIVKFKKSGDDLTVTSNVHLNVSFGPITFFDYVMESTEHWKNDQLVSMSARTKSDNTWKPLSVEAVEGGYRITGAKFKGIVPSLVPSSHWNIAEMSQHAMLEPETGVMQPMTVTDIGLEQVKTGQGMIEARHYRMKSQLDADFWYDALGRWVKTAFVTQGSRIDYVLRAVPR